MGIMYAVSRKTCNVRPDSDLVPQMPSNWCPNADVKRASQQIESFHQATNDFQFFYRYYRFLAKLPIRVAVTLMNGLRCRMEAQMWRATSTTSSILCTCRLKGPTRQEHEGFRLGPVLPSGDFWDVPRIPLLQDVEGTN